ncbi:MULTISPECIES: hypothetical protein [Cytobacillus]|uniref:hypothetical protein n=1 Tax=Cytobacillus TaxID=2675230 RepID=UPI0025A1F9B0|nr:hypothetical protein [Cytobacillus kochii]MDM5208405.1 hypothetical protein [Cytobacillus kochii]
MNKQDARMLQLIGGNIINISKVISPKINKDNLILNKIEYMDNITKCINSGYECLFSINSNEKSPIMDGEYNSLVTVYRKLLICLEDLLQNIDGSIINIKLEDLSTHFSNLKKIEVELSLATIQMIEKISEQSK